MLERLINEDREGAEELFHEIVVEKSRDIYESLLEADLEDEEVDEATDEEVDESDDEEVDESADEDEDEDDLDEGFDLDEFEVEADPMDMMGGDPADDMMGAMEPADDDGMDMGDEDEDMEDRVEDLEDALADLKAEFEKMMAGDDEGEDDDMDDMDMGGEEEGEDDDDEEEMESFEDEVEEGSYKKKMKKSGTEEMREYVEKVSAKMGDNGANTKSTVAGKNDMGGTTANITSGGESKSEGTQGGLAAPTTKEDNAGNVNVPGAKGATKMASQPGHGAEKKGKPETADKGAGSPINGVKTRAK
jgi:hypothetical protein